MMSGDEPAIRYSSRKTASASTPKMSSTVSDPTAKESLTVPSPMNCYRHLRLLETFFVLREEISMKDGLYGIRDDFVPSTADEHQKNQILAKIREKRWAVYVTNASLRFEQWWKTSIPKQDNTKFRTAKGVMDTAPLKFSHNDLPPLGKQSNEIFYMFLISHRRAYGLAFIHA